MKRAILYISVILITLLLSSCFVNSNITVTIYNSTRVTTGTLHVIYGNYEAYEDGEQDFYNVSYPYTFTIPNETECANYIIIAQLELNNVGSSLGDVLLDTQISPNTNTTINLMLYKVNENIADDYETDNGFASSSFIQAGEYQARSLSDTNDIDYISFYAVDGITYTIETYIHSGNATILTINDSDTNHQQLASDTNSGSNGSKITWPALSSGVRFITVDNNNSTTSYGLMLSSTSSGNAIQNAHEKLVEWSTHKK